MCRNRYSRSMRNGRFCFCSPASSESGAFLPGPEIHIDKGSRINKPPRTLATHPESHMEKTRNFATKS